MNSIKERAEQFFDACETGKGWDVCKEFCHPDASFSAQAGALADVDTVESYSEWMKGLLTPVPDRGSRSRAGQSAAAGSRAKR